MINYNIRVYVIFSLLYVLLVTKTNRNSRDMALCFDLRYFHIFLGLSWWETDYVTSILYSKHHHGKLTPFCGLVLIVDVKDLTLLWFYQYRAPKTYLGTHYDNFLDSLLHSPGEMSILLGFQPWQIAFLSRRCYDWINEVLLDFFPTVTNPLSHHSNQ